METLSILVIQTEVRRVCEGGGLYAGGRAGYRSVVCGAVSSHRKEEMAAAHMLGLLANIWLGWTLTGCF